MKQLLPILLLFFILAWSRQSGAQTAPEGYSDRALSGELLSGNRIDQSGEAAMNPWEEVFSLEAVYGGSECNGRLTSFLFTNAHFPLTWHELDEKGSIVRSDQSLPLEELKDNTLYIVEDKFQFTDTIMIRLQRKIGFQSIYPNPARDEVMLKIETYEPLSVRIGFSDMHGRRISDRTHSIAPGDLIELPLEGLSRGIYLLDLRGRCIAESKKLIILPD